MEREVEEGRDGGEMEGRWRGGREGSYLVHLLQFVSDGRKPSHELVQPLLTQLFKPPPCSVSLTGEGVQFC